MGVKDLGSVEIVEVDGLSKNDRRAAYFLRTADDFVNAETMSQKLEKKSSTAPSSKKLKRALGMWVDGHDNQPKLHHGWDKSEFGGEFTSVHVFKGNEHRLYGYKYHPDNNPRHQACVVVFYYQKGGNDAPAEEMRKMLRIMRSPAVQKKLQERFGKERV